MGAKFSRKATKYEGKELPPEGTAAYEIMSRIGFWTITFIDRWYECTKSEKHLNFPKHGTLNQRRLQFLHYGLNKLNQTLCAREYEALNKWEGMALEKEREKFQEKFRRH